MTDADHIERINALTRNARNTWFGLLGVLVFVSITLMGVEHIDFYGVNRATKLPLVDVDVPTKSFFLAAPLLTAAIFGYFHLYLIRLWDALSQAPFEVNGQPLGDAVSPWLVTDAALHLRAKLRQEFCASPRTLEGPAMVLNLALAWGFGIAVLGWLWIESMPAREIWITVVAAIALLASAFAGVSSLSLLPRRMYRAPAQTPDAYRPTISALLTLVVAIPLIGGYSFERTMGRADRLAVLDLEAQSLVEKPAGWLPRDIARKDFRATWCKRETVEKCKELSDDQRNEFDAEWKTRRAGQLADLIKPDWHRDEDKPNLRKANLQRAFLSGADLREAQMEGADLRGAQMEGAVLRGAQMEGAVLRDAQMEGAVLRDAQMEGAVLWRAQMEGAVLSGAQMEGADLRGARMKGAVLWRAQMEGADLRWAQMEGADLRGARMKGADLRWAQMEGAVLRDAQMEGADLREAQMEGADLREAQMEGADLSGAQMEGADLREAQMEGAVLWRAQMEGADLRWAQMEGAVLWRAQMEGAEFDFSLLTGAKGDQISLGGTNLSAAINDGGALRFVDLRGAIFDARTDFRNAFMDASVQLPDGFAEQMGGLCQRVDRELSDEEFFGYWRGWTERGDSEWDGPFGASPPEWRNVTPIPPPEGCEWKRGPLPGHE